MTTNILANIIIVFITNWTSFVGFETKTSWNPYPMYTYTNNIIYLNGLTYSSNNGSFYFAQSLNEQDTCKWMNYSESQTNDLARYGEVIKITYYECDVFGRKEISRQTDRYIEQHGKKITTILWEWDDFKNSTNSL